MDPSLDRLFANNRRWAAERTAADPGFFERLSDQQTPRFLWIGCSDSRVPANEIVGLAPGELFVHRNVANLVVHSDMNCLSVLQFAVDILKVEHVIVCGHYSCGGVRAAYEDAAHGLVDNWLRHVRDTIQRRRESIDHLPADTAIRRLCELNVTEQVVNVGNTTIVQDAWRRGERLTIHGWIYDLADGLLRDLGTSIASAEDLRRELGRI